MIAGIVLGGAVGSVVFGALGALGGALLGSAAAVGALRHFATRTP